MKKTFLIILIILLIVLGGLAATHRAEAPVVPETTVITEQTPTADIPEVSPDRVRGPERTTIAIGTSAEINGIDIALNSLTQDSRCPAQVTCIHAGSVSVATTVSRDGMSADHEFSTNADPFIFEGYRISIVGVAPIRATPTALKPADYRITFEITPTAQGDNI